MPRMVTWCDRQYYDIGTDRMVSRISGFDEHSQEHWTVIEVSVKGSAYRERRDETVLAIQDAIEEGHQPGEVTCQ